MLRLYLIFIAVIGTINELSAQCPTGNVTLSTQLEVDQYVNDFSNCTKINGFLYIDGPTINNLSGLTNLREIDSFFYIANTAITELDFNKLNTIGGDLSLHINSNLQTINLDNLTSVNGDLYFHQNSSVTNINLNTLTSNNGNIYFHQNTSLVSVQLCNITEINGYLYLYQNSLLSSICLDNLTRINGYFYLEQSNLDSLDTFNNVSEILGYLTITNNPNLNNCNGLCNVLMNNGVSGAITLNNNPSGCSSLSELQNNCSVLSTNEYFSDNFFMYPNPTNGIINFNSKNIEHLIIHDLRGAIVKKVVVASDKVDVSDLKKGTYFISFIKNNTTFVTSIIKN